MNLPYKSVPTQLQKAERLPSKNSLGQKVNVRETRHRIPAVVRVEAASRAWLIIMHIAVERWCFLCDLASDHILSPFTYLVICLLLHILDVPDLQ